MFAQCAEIIIFIIHTTSKMVKNKAGTVFRVTKNPFPMQERLLWKVG